MTKLINIDQIKPDPNQPRKVFENIGQLADSIVKNGMLQPILVDKDLIILDGERRYQAAKSVNVDMVPVIVYNRSLDEPGKRMVLQLVSDLHHNRLKEADQSKAVLQLYSDLGEPSTEEFAKVLQKTPAAIRDILERARFVAKMDDVPQNLRGDVVTETKKLKDPQLREQVIKKIHEEGIHGRDARRQFIDQVKEADPVSQREILKTKTDEYTRRANYLIQAMKTVTNDLNLEVYNAIPSTQQLIISGLADELRRHLKTWQAVDQEV